MAYGISIQNPSGELVIDAEARGLYCIGRATLISTTTYTETGTSPNITRNWASGLYRINSSRPIVIAHELMNGYRCGIRSVVQSSPGVWDIRAFNSTSFPVHSVPTTFVDFAVWAFSELPTTPSGYGMVLYKQDGTPAWDLTHNYPLFPRQHFTVNFNGTGSIVSLTRPALLGPQVSWKDEITNAGVNRYLRRLMIGGHVRNGNNVTAVEACEQSSFGTAVDPPDGDGDLFPTSSFILEGNDLP
jgi:hypothetical protein